MLLKNITGTAPSEGWDPLVFKVPTPLMHSLRLVKSKPEIDLLQKAVDITNDGFKRVLKFVKPGATGG